MAAPMLLDMVLETATNPGTAAFVLNGAVPDRRAFIDACPAGGQVFYFADDSSQAEWGIGIFVPGTPNILRRQEILQNTLNTTATLNFTGTVRVYSSVPAAFLPLLDSIGSLALNGDISAKNASLQSVTLSADPDWTSRQAVPAALADQRYQPLGNYQPSGDYQAAGDYATNDAVKNQGNNLSRGIDDANANANGRVSKGGDTVDGDLKVAAGHSLYADTLAAQSTGGNLSVQGLLSQTGTPSPSDNSNNIPTCSWVKSALPMDSARKMLAFKVSNISTRSRITFPESFSKAWTPIVVPGTEINGPYDTLVPVNISGVDESGFTVSNWSSNVVPVLHILAIGPK